jgi:tetratricopeptide (TPR) repeat protein
LGACLLVLLVLAPLPAAAPQAGGVGEARRLRDAGRFDEAVKTLDTHLREYPDDVDASRLRAQTLYWLKDLAAAEATYAGALARHPEHEGLRLDYARMLAETGRLHEAAALLDRHRDGRGSAEWSALLGTIHYWRGDRSSAKRLFEAALRHDPAHADAARQLREIRAASAPWLRIEPRLWHDDQPLDAAGVAFEAGWFLTPLTSMAVRSRPVRYATGSAQTFWLNEVEFSSVAPLTRFETRLAAGAFRGTGEGYEWTGHATVGIRAAGGLTLRGRVDRSPYTATLASIAEPIMTTTAAASLHLDRRGWLGEATIRRDAYPDENAVRSAYAWLLAPIARGRSGSLQAGYAIAAADADEDRFVLTHPQQPYPPTDPRFDFTGVYQPYFTPARQLAHSAIAAVTAGVSGGAVFKAGGSYGFRAKEDATAFQASGAEVIAVVDRRDYTPWTARASLEIPASRVVSVSIGGEAGRTAYYRWATAQLALTFRFIPAADR